MGPGIAAEPHCAEREIAGLRFLPTLHPEGKASAVHDPCALAQASRRSRSAARSPGLFPAASALVRPRAFPSRPPGSAGAFRIDRHWSEDHCFPHRSAPTVLVLASASNLLRSEERCNLPSLGLGPGPASLAFPGKPVPAQVATNRPFAALLGTIVFRAALITPLRGTRPAAVRRSSLPAPLAGFASKILRFAPSGHPGEAQSSQHRIPLRRRAGGDRKFLSFPAA